MLVTASIPSVFLAHQPGRVAHALALQLKKFWESQYRTRVIWNEAGIAPNTDGSMTLPGLETAMPRFILTAPAFLPSPFCLYEFSAGESTEQSVAVLHGIAGCEECQPIYPVTQHWMQCDGDARIAQDDIQAPFRGWTRVAKPAWRLWGLF